MTRKRLALPTMEHRIKPKRIDLPTCWSPAQATAVFEFLDELRGRILDQYAVEIREFLQDDRVSTTRLKRTDIKDGNVPF
jgi:hypothetical protein